MPYSVVSLSGGMDSATVLGFAKGLLDKHHPVPIRTVGFVYGSKHNFLENIAAGQIANHYGVRFDLIDLTSAFKLIESDLLKSGGPIPEGHYEHETMKRTVVPGRNMIFGSILAGIAASGPPVERDPFFKGEVQLGIHAGDHLIYPDCRPVFFYAMRTAIDAATDTRSEKDIQKHLALDGVDLGAPLLTMTKVQVLLEAVRLKVPLHLTRTCYTDHPIACGKCGSCRERLAAFKAVGMEDPLPYQYRDPNPERTAD